MNPTLRSNVASEPSDKTYNSHVIRKTQCADPLRLWIHMLASMHEELAQHKRTKPLRFVFRVVGPLAILFFVLSTGRVPCDLICCAVGPLCDLFFVCRVVGSLAIRVSCGRAPCDSFFVWSTRRVPCDLMFCAVGPLCDFVFVCRLANTRGRRNQTYEISLGQRATASVSKHAGIT